MKKGRQIKGKYGIVHVDLLPSGRVNVSAALLRRGYQAGESDIGADLTRSEVRRVIAALQASVQ